MCFHRGNTPKLWPGCNEGFSVMAPLAVPHHFLLVPPFAITASCAISWELKGERCVSYVKQVALAETWDGLCAFPPAPRLFPLSLARSPVSVSWVGVGVGGWGVGVAGWGRLWSLAEGRYGSISVAFLREVCSAIINHVREGIGMLISQQLQQPVCQLANSEHESHLQYEAVNRHLAPQQPIHGM